MTLETFTTAYIECALWSSTDNNNESGGSPLDDNYDESDIAPETLETMKGDCRDFYEAAGNRLLEIQNGDVQAGHDFWLTRNGHGAGFWDGHWPTNGQWLTDMSKPYGTFDLYIGDDNKVHGQWACARRQAGNGNPCH